MKFCSSYHYRKIKNVFFGVFCKLFWQKIKFHLSFQKKEIARVIWKHNDDCMSKFHFFDFFIRSHQKGFVSYNEFIDKTFFGTFNCNFYPCLQFSFLGQDEVFS